MSKVTIKNLVWIDLEMTGLNAKRDRIIEIATIVTDNYLNILAYGPVLAIHQDNKILNSMDIWNIEQHTKTGLIDRVLQSCIKEEEAEEQTLQFLKKYVKPGSSPMCGDSVYKDRYFLLRYMPKLEQFFYYRNLDVRTIRILAQLWRSDVKKELKKNNQNMALQDIKNSIEELKFYRKNFIKI
ncbi:oligoribonuclease [Gammaproteobacteria bacterium]